MGDRFVAKYGIIRMMKFKKTDVQGIQKHNQRQFSNSINKDIDSTRTNLNYDLVNEKKIRYESTINEKIQERVKRKVRANSVVLSEFLVTASPEYMERLEPGEQKRYFETSLDFLKERYGVENTIYANVHMDEKTPHMHVGIIPITEDGRLSAKDIYTKNELKGLQDAFAKRLQASGFDIDRGEPGDSKNAEKVKNVPINEFKKKKDLEKEIQQLEVIKNENQEKLKEQFNTFQSRKNELHYMSETVINLQEEVTSLEEMKKNNEEKLKKQFDEFQIQRGKIKEMQNNALNLDEKLRELDEKQKVGVKYLDYLESLKTQKNEEMEQLEKEIEQYEQIRDSAENYSKSVTYQNAKLTEERNELIQKNEELKKRYENNKKVITKQNERIKSVNDEFRKTDELIKNAHLKKTFIGKSDIVEIPKKDFNGLVSYAKKGETYKRNAEVAWRENDDLKRNNASKEKVLQNAMNRNEYYQEENKKLKEENTGLKKELERFKKFVTEKNMFEEFKRWYEEQKKKLLRKKQEKDFFK